MSETETRSTGRRIKKVFEGTCGLLLFAAVTLSMVEIVCRVFFKISVDLFFDFTVWGTVWALLLITGLLLPEGGHVSIDFFKEKFSGRFRWLLEAVLALITLAYGAFVTWGSVLFLRQLYQRGSVFPRQIPIPMWLVELCVPIGMGIFTIYAAIELIKAVRTRW
jgi:TRAP-type C4-dicarboxylate transport system permease small subunit